MNILVQKIIDKIDSLLNGEIKELEFGCRVSYFFHGVKRTNTIVSRHQRTNRLQVVLQNLGCHDTGRIVAISKKDIVDIQGIPISKHLLEKAIFKLGEKYDMISYKGGVDNQWRYNYPDDIIEQCRWNKELMKFICEIFEINPN